MKSPLPWMGGKFYSASRIVSAFPPASSYSAYVDLFGGAAHVLLARPTDRRHKELYNDLNNDLVNFWLMCRDRAEELQERLDSLPYSRALYYQYYKDVHSDMELEPLERAARWFYTVRCGFNARERDTSPSGWSASTERGNAHSYHSAVSLFAVLQERFKDVLIDNRDFRYVLKAHSKPRTLFYCDPPYISTEHYYRGGFKEEDHISLAQLLNDTPAYVALSYYPHPLVDELYAPDKWRRLSWRTPKHSQRGGEHHDYATELLLCNYAPPVENGTLWQE